MTKTSCSLTPVRAALFVLVVSNHAALVVSKQHGEVVKSDIIQTKVQNGRVLTKTFWVGDSLQDGHPSVSQLRNNDIRTLGKHEVSNKDQNLNTELDQRSATITGQSSQVAAGGTATAGQSSHVTSDSTTTKCQCSQFTTDRTTTAVESLQATNPSTSKADQSSPINKLTDSLPSTDANKILYYDDYKNKEEEKNQNDKSPNIIGTRNSQVLKPRHFFLTDNPPDETMVRSQCKLVDNGTKADCSFMNLTRVPPEGLPYTITNFDLHNNSITNLPNNVFINYTRLQYLDLSNNIIYQLDELAFSGLEHLETLNLWNNRLAMSDSTFPEKIFASLPLLHELRIHRNNPNCKNSTGLNYPDEALSHLTNLRTLYMDGLNNVSFRSGFLKLAHLTSLSLAGYHSGCCSIKALPNATFQYFPNITDLNIKDCNIFGQFVEPDAFSGLQKLVALNINHNEDIDMQHWDDIFYGLNKIKSLKVLLMSLVVNRYSIGICLDSSFIRNFPKYLEHLEFQENNLEGLDRQVIRTLSPSIKTLDVSGNRFVFGTYLRDLHLMKKLTHLKYNGVAFTYTLPDRYPYLLSRYKASSNCTLYGSSEVEMQNHTFILRLPPNLKVVEMNQAGLTFLLSRLEVDPNNSLQNLSMHSNSFPQLVGPFEGLHSLKHLDLSHCFVRYISNIFFTNLTSLVTLNLSSNLLRDFFSSQSDPQVFLPLTNLTILDLSFNDVHSLSGNVFAGLTNLQALYLQRNSLIEFAVNISHMWSLTLLNISGNRMTSLPPDIQKHIGFLLGQGHNVTVDMSQCPIFCTCENLAFITWMKQSKAFDQTFPQYDCVYADDFYKHITDGYTGETEWLRRQCTSNRNLFFGVTAAMCLLFGVIFCTVLYRFRWKLRYLYYAAHVLYRPASKENKKMEFEYDAFVSYDQQDEAFVIGQMLHELERRGLNLCIHGRDFRVGEHIASNIVRAVCASRKTLVVLTRNLTDSYWCGYEIQMANMEAVYTGRQVLLFLLKEEIPDGVLGKELLYHIRNNTYIAYPDPLPDARSIGLLWDKLAADLRD